MKNRIFSTIFWGLLVMAHSAFGQVAPASDRNYIFTEGTAEITGQNDSARINVAVQTEGRDLEMTSSKNADNTKAVIRALKDINIKNLKFKTTNYRVTPQKDFKSRPPKIKGYEAYNEVEVTAEGYDPEELANHVPRILGVALESGANNIRNIQFYIKNRQPLEKEGLSQATQEAIERAKILAEAAGVKLKRIASISTQPIHVPVMQQRYRASEMMNKGASVEPPIEAGESKVRVRVSIAYELE